MVKVFQEMEEKEEEKARIAGSSAHARLSLRVRPVFACTRWPAAATRKRFSPRVSSSHSLAAWRKYCCASPQPFLD